MKIFSAHPKQAHCDQSLIGVVLLGSALILWYAMRPDAHNTALVGLLLCKPLVFLFGDLAGLVPILMGCLGGIMAFDDPDPLIMQAMTVASWCYLLMFCQYFQTGFIGHLSSNASRSVFGDFSPYVLYASFVLLTFSMLGISFRRSVKQVFRAIVQFCWMLWEIRVPSISSVFGPKHAYEAPVKNAVPIAVPVKVPSRDPVIDAEYTVAEAPQPKRRYSQYYKLPHILLFDEPILFSPSVGNYEQTIVDILASFKVGVTVTKKIVGSSVTRYELTPGKGVAVGKISARADDIALALAAKSIRILAPIPGEAAVGIEVPNLKASVVSLREVLDSLNEEEAALPVALGKDVTGKAIISDLHDMPHLLVAGSTGSGKSVCLNSIIASLLFYSTPDHVQMLFIDPKRVELSIYNGIPHLLRPVITEPLQAAGALEEMAREMESRYKTLEQARCLNIGEFNLEFPEKKLPYIVIVIDELADLMITAGKAVESLINRLAAKARATGIHLIVATQRPSTDVITGVIKNNIPSRIAFAVPSHTDSRVILDANGAELLLGRGDMLFKPMDALHASRLQGAFVTSKEIKRLVEFWSSYTPPNNMTEIPGEAVREAPGEVDDIDPLIRKASSYVIDLGYASTAKLKDQLQVGHSRASRLMQSLEELGVVGPNESTKPRRVLITANELNDILSSKAA